jgi:hypothetical protein
MAAMGLRKGVDFDVIALDNILDQARSHDLSLQNEYFTAWDADDLVMNPRRHVVVMGSKIMSVGELIR